MHFRQILSLNDMRLRSLTLSPQCARAWLPFLRGEALEAPPFLPTACSCDFLKVKLLVAPAKTVIGGVRS
eukprot:2720397-Heterocapsa_arctica.AAC.1